MARPTWRIHPKTEIASEFTVGRYREIRHSLQVNEPPTHEWAEVLGAFQRRIGERFLGPIKELERHDKQERRKRPTRAGFAILALDCLLIDTIQSYREGRISTGDASPARSFKDFLSKSTSFRDFKSHDREDFFGDVRNGLLHNGETRANWIIRLGMERLLTKDGETKNRIIDRQKFHSGVVAEYKILCDQIRSDAKVRLAFLRRMDAICGLETTVSGTGSASDSVSS